MPKSRRRWFTFSLRSLLVLMALVALGLAWWQRSSRFAERARHHAEQADQLADTAWGMQRFGGFTDEADGEAQVYWRRYAYHDELARQFNRAAWLGFVPGPQETEKE